MELNESFFPKETFFSTPSSIEARETPSIEDLDKPVIVSSSEELVDTSSLDEKIAFPFSHNTEVESHLFSAEGRYLPENGGEWSGDRGNSDWGPEDGISPNKHNPEEMTWRQIKDVFGFESIPFEEGEPNFEAVSEATVEIDDFTVDRNANFTQADEACAEQWTEKNENGKAWTAAEVRAYRKENGLSWHERSDQKTMDLVPSLVHGNIPHTGGISAAKKGTA
ncbi:HNH endonuclease [Vreelandella sulfidaeris]|uniref:HNH endonuclease n=1 Tax=Vreelandella sulfidaeris TaxID=115553 RepID=UPI0035F06DC1